MFAPYPPPAQIDSYIAGLILLAAAPCTAMVFVWSGLTHGEPHFTLTQVALNDTIMIFAFAPLVGLLLGLSAIIVPWDTLFISVLLYILIPVVLAQLWRRYLLRRGEASLKQTLDRLHLFSLTALLATLVFAIRVSRSGDNRAAVGHRHARGADLDSGVFPIPGSPIGSTAASAWRTAWPGLRP